jgi:serine/threonine protein kinase
MRDNVFKPGDLCDRYRIVRLLATGGQGEVYVATQEFIERDVALKTVRAPLAGRAEFHERLKTEAKLLGRIQHPNVVTVFDAGITSAGVIYIAMQLLEGQTLRDALRAIGRVPIPQALQVCAQIADGLESAHEIGIVHRDVKPENIFITEQNSLKILDLGTAKLIHAGLRTSRADAVTGTLWYMAPEQIISNKASPRSDVYALGLILLEMIKGSHAFSQSDGSPLDKYQLGLRQLYQDPTPLPQQLHGFPSYVWDLIAKAIAKEPAERHASMSEFAADARVARRRMVDEVRAQGLVPGYVDLSQRPSKASPASLSASPMQTALSTSSSTRIDEPHFVNDRFRTEPLDDLATSLAHDLAPELAPIQASSAPIPAASAPIQPISARIDTRQTTRIVPVPVVPLRAAAAAPPSAGADQPPARDSHPIIGQRIFDVADHQTDVNQGLAILRALPHAEAIVAALVKLREADPNSRFALGCAIAAIPRAYDAYALALATAIIDLANNSGAARDNARHFVLTAVHGYVPESLPHLQSTHIFPDPSANPPAVQYAAQHTAAQHAAAQHAAAQHAAAQHAAAQHAAAQHAAAQHAAAQHAAAQHQRQPTPSAAQDWRYQPPPSLPISTIAHAPAWVASSAAHTPSPVATPISNPSVDQAADAAADLSRTAALTSVPPMPGIPSPAAGNLAISNPAFSNPAAPHAALPQPPAPNSRGSVAAHTVPAHNRSVLIRRALSIGALVGIALAIILTVGRLALRGSPDASSVGASPASPPIQTAVKATPPDPVSRGAALSVSVPPAPAVDPAAASPKPIADPAPPTPASPKPEAKTSQTSSARTPAQPGLAAPSGPTDPAKQPAPSPAATEAPRAPAPATAKPAARAPKAPARPSPEPTVPHGLPASGL